MSDQQEPSVKHEHKFTPIEVAFSADHYAIGYFVVRWACSIENCAYDEYDLLEASEL